MRRQRGRHGFAWSSSGKRRPRPERRTEDSASSGGNSSHPNREQWACPFPCAEASRRCVHSGADPGQATGSARTRNRAGFRSPSPSWRCGRGQSERYDEVVVVGERQHRVGRSREQADARSRMGDPRHHARPARWALLHEAPLVLVEPAARGPGRPLLRLLTPGTVVIVG